MATQAWVNTSASSTNTFTMYVGEAGAPPKDQGEDMLEKILKLYTMAMVADVRSPLPHLFGPPGCGKSSVVEEAAELIGCDLHITNVSRISPLDLEGVQMPVPDGGDSLMLKLLHATQWTDLKEGDILLLDEFLRGFPEVYNGLLDIITSRQVGGYKLPKVFIIAASNSTVAYDKALEDRLLHLPVPDPRTSKRAKTRLAELIVSNLGLMPDMKDSMQMQTLLDTEVLPMYEVLDAMNNKSQSTAVIKGSSVRNLIGQALLREVQSQALKELINYNNNEAYRQNKEQCVLLINGTQVADSYAARATALRGNDKLTKVQASNLELNLQLMEMEEIRREKGTEDDDDDIESDIF